MLIVRERLEGTPPADVELRLSHEARRRLRQRGAMAGGEEVALLLERGSMLRDGDRLRADDGRVVGVVAADEALMEVTATSPEALARAAYHLGNRHCAVAIGDGRLRFPADHVLAQMLRSMGLAVTSVTAPFDPEPGAYAGGHHHHSGEAKHAGIIHDFARKPGDAR
jgi:urease accessory protein